MVQEAEKTNNLNMEMVQGQVQTMEKANNMVEVIVQERSQEN